MTKRECAIVMAYTGVIMLTGDDLERFYKYIDKKLGRKVQTFELASMVTWQKIREACKDDFEKLCKEAR